MSLKAAEKARRASEEFVQRVNDLIPDNPKKYHKDLVMGIDDKLSLLKKNVAYLVLQNLSLIDKLIDAENTVHEVRSLQELQNNWKDRPNTFAAPDTPNENDFCLTNNDRCESWCNPPIDYLFFNSNASDVQSRKLSITDKFVSNRLRQYVIREDLMDDLEPHLATHLFTSREKDSDNDSGNGEEIVSPDEYETSSQIENSSVSNSNDKLDRIHKIEKIKNISELKKIDQFEKAEKFDKMEKFDTIEKFDKTAGLRKEAETLGGEEEGLSLTSSPATLGNFSVLTCSEGIVAEKSGNRVVGVVSNGGLLGAKIETVVKHELGHSKGFGSLDQLKPLKMRDIAPSRSATNTNTESKKRGFSAFGSTFSEERIEQGDLSINEDTSSLQTNGIQSSTKKTETSNELKRNTTRFTSIRGQFEKDMTSSSNGTKLQTETANQKPPTFSSTKSSLFETNVKKQSNYANYANYANSNTTTNSTVPKLSSTDSVFTKMRDDDINITTATSGAHLAKSSSLENNINIAGNGTSYPRYGLKHQGMRTYSQQSSLDSTNSDDSASTYTSINSERRGSRNQSDDVTDTNQRMNFSSKVNRGNKLRKSKRIEESHRFFESKSDCPKNEQSNVRRSSDFALRYTSVGGGGSSSLGSAVSSSRFSEGARNKPSFNKYVTQVKSRAGSLPGDVSIAE